MKTVNLDLIDHSYPIWINYSLTDRICFLLETYKSTKWVFFTQKSIYRYWENRLIGILEKDKIDYEIIFLEEGERGKSIKLISNIYNRLIKMGCNRDTIFLGLGGGVVGDATGFIASTFMRGVSYFQIPTTLLSMVDSSIGGKTAINTSKGKNLVGSFYQPKGVLIDPDFLDTIKDEEIFSAVSEIAKYGILFDKSFFSYLNKNLKSIINRNANILLNIITRCCEFKANIVSIDEFDKGKRKLLNFGHTYGHALEFNYNFNHGQSVAYGILFSTYYSHFNNGLNKKNFNRIFNFFMNLNLPKIIKPNAKELLKLMKRDKKKDNDGINFVLIKDIGIPYFDKIEDNKIINYIEEFHEYISNKWS